MDKNQIDKQEFKVELYALDYKFNVFKIENKESSALGPLFANDFLVSPLLHQFYSWEPSFLKDSYKDARQINIILDYNAQKKVFCSISSLNFPMADSSTLEKTIKRAYIESQKFEYPKPDENDLPQFKLKNIQLLLNPNRQSQPCQVESISLLEIRLKDKINFSVNSFQISIGKKSCYFKCFQDNQRLKIMFSSNVEYQIWKKFNLALSLRS